MSDLRTLAESQARAAERLSEVKLSFSHPVYQYLARRYGLAGPSLHWEPEAVPDAAAWQAFERLAAREGIQIMLWEAPPHPETARRLAALGVDVVVYAPSGDARAAEDWLAGCARTQRNSRTPRNVTEAQCVRASAFRTARSGRGENGPAVAVRDRSGTVLLAELSGGSPPRRAVAHPPPESADTPDQV